MRRLETVIRSRAARTALVASLGAFGVWSFAPYVVSDVSTRAAVNAPLVHLTATVEGTVPALPGVGRYYPAASNIELVRPSVDTGELAEIMAGAELADATLTLANRQLAELTAEEARLTARARVFATATAKRLGADYDGAAAAARACSAELTEREAALDRAEKLGASGFLSPAGIERARSAAAAARSACEADRARLASLDATRRAAAAGVYLADSYNDAPYAEQQRDRLLLRRQELEKVAVEALSRKTEAARRLAEARARTRYTAPPGTIVWAHLASPGAAVRAGEPVLDVVDCRRRFVEVALPERRAEAIRAGDTADVRLIGSDEWRVGRVARVAGAAARRSGLLLAAQAESLADDREISVEVTLPPPDHARPDRRCDIGRLAEVRFGRSG